MIGRDSGFRIVMAVTWKVGALYALPMYPAHSGWKNVLPCTPSRSASAVS